MEVDLKLQERILSLVPGLPALTPDELLECIRSCLFRAHNEGVLQGGIEAIYQNVKMAKDKAAYAITGGIKDFRRDPQNAKLIRDDGAWIHFTMTVKWDGKRSLEIIAYDFEIVFVADHKPGFLRFDLNPPDHHNADRELRSHFHPGNDDLIAPAPLLAPEEILNLLLFGLRARDPDRPRA